MTIPPAGVSPAARDWLRFLVDTEKVYGDQMRAYLQNDLGFKKANIIDTQIAWGSMTALTREAASSYADNHAYWNHPTFLGGDWDPKNYRVTRQALVDRMAESGGFGGTLWDLASNRVGGKPYSISEYNHPAPSDFQTEMMPLYAAFGAAQDWDILYTFDWSATGTGIDSSFYSGYFDSAMNPGKTAFYPATALMFRNFEVPAFDQFVTAGVPVQEPWSRGFTAGEVWSKVEKKLSPFAARYAMVPGGKDAAVVPFAPNRTKMEIADRTFVTEAPASRVVSGFVAGRTVKAGDLTLEFGNFANGFAAVTLVSTDGQPLSKAKRSLLTVGARVENTGMAWNAARDSVSDQWGKGPVIAERVPLRLTLATDGPRTAYSLDATGKRKNRLPASYANGVLTVDGTQADSMWIEIVK